MPRHSDRRRLASGMLLGAGLLLLLLLLLLLPLLVVVLVAVLAVLGEPAVYTYYKYLSGNGSS